MLERLTGSCYSYCNTLVPRHKLTLTQAIALSVGIMGPTLAMALNGVGVAALVGPAVPLVFLLGFVGVCLVGYGFVWLTRYFNHAGSVYALAGATIGPGRVSSADSR